MIVIDTNIIMSALIKDSITRKIIIESGLQFAYPEISLHEIFKHEAYILKKSGYSKTKFEVILNKLLEYINLVPIGIIKPKLNRAKEVMKNIDINNTVFLAAALALDNADIWSDDADFERQKLVKAVKTEEIVKEFKK